MRQASKLSLCFLFFSFLLLLLLFKHHDERWVSTVATSQKWFPNLRPVLLSTLYFTVYFIAFQVFHFDWLLYESVEITNKMQPCNRIYYSKVYWRLIMFRAAYRSSSGALNCICSLWFIYTCGERPVTTYVYKPEAANTV
jgi:hypothetical protein